MKARRVLAHLRRPTSPILPLGRAVCEQPRISHPFAGINPYPELCFANAPGYEPQLVTDGLMPWAMLGDEPSWVSLDVIALTFRSRRRCNRAAGRAKRQYTLLL
jgi:hypothetical protein